MAGVPLAAEAAGARAGPGPAGRRRPLAPSRPRPALGTPPRWAWPPPNASPSSDEDIVSGAVEPKDPWRHAQNVTVEEIIGAYQQACHKLNCKQIPKLVKQIQEFTDLAHRIDCLDLKGEKLDYKACEALEEIFKRLQFKVVDLEQTSLDEDGASALFDMIEYYESATHLNISFNKHIGTRGWQAAAHMMRKVSVHLQALEVRVVLSPSEVFLHTPSATLSLSGRPLVLLGDHRLKMNMNLRELYLADNKLNGLQDSAQLGNLLKFNCSIQILDLRNNHILDSGLAYICEGLKEQRKGLATLVLWNNQLTHTGMCSWPHTQSLETLNLGHNPIGNEGVRNLKNGLIGNRSVLRLGLASTKLTCEGAVAVAEFIAESPRLLRLDLRENEIKTGGLMALSLALKVNQSLLRLDLDREPKKEAVKSFIETQKALLAEIQNGCKRNFVLAREEEEKEQQLQLSASMPEITVTEAAQEEEVTVLGEPADEAQENGHLGEARPEAPRPAEDSDSDTEEEEEDEDDGGQEHEATRSPEVQLSTIAGNSLSSRARTPPGSPAPSAPEKRISVSSPGRGHKVFVVTRVESPPEKAGEALALQTEAPTNRSGAGLGPPDLPLPNGLKPEFAHALPDSPAGHGGPEGKGGGCGLEHELSCSKNEKELEELLLEASQESGQETL
uniref:Protein phosphatase 1 regulatory subunit 37 n=1 Tax=Sarcophilus harrisii TaxID=9305 RepID=G3VSC2_SARHA